MGIYIEFLFVSNIDFATTGLQTFLIHRITFSTCITHFLVKSCFFIDFDSNFDIYCKRVEGGRGHTRKACAYTVDNLSAYT